MSDTEWMVSLTVHAADPDDAARLTERLGLVLNAYVEDGRQGMLSVSKYDEDTDSEEETIVGTIGTGATPEVGHEP